MKLQTRRLKSLRWQGTSLFSYPYQRFLFPSYTSRPRQSCFRRSNLSLFLPHANHSLSIACSAFLMLSRTPDRTRDYVFAFLIESIDPITWSIFSFRSQIDASSFDASQSRSRPLSRPSCFGILSEHLNSSYGSFPSHLLLQVHGYSQSRPSRYVINASTSAPVNDLGTDLHLPNPIMLIICFYRHRDVFRSSNSSVRSHLFTIDGISDALMAYQSFVFYHSSSRSCRTTLAIVLFGRQTISTLCWLPLVYSFGFKTPDSVLATLQALSRMVYFDLDTKI